MSCGVWMGLVLAWLWRLCILYDTVFVFVCLAVPSARCLLLVVLCAAVVKRESRKNRQGICMAFNAPLYFLFMAVKSGIYLSYYLSFIFFFKEARDINIDAEWSRRSQFLALLHERRVGDWLQPAVLHSRAVGNPRQKLDLTIKNLILVPTWSRCCLGFFKRTLQNCRPFHWCCACLSLQ